MLKTIKKSILDFYKNRDWHNIVNFTNILVNGTKVKRKDNVINEIFIFYHLYLVNDWKPLLLEYLKAIDQSDLLSRISKIYICAIYHDEKHVVELKKLLQNFNKSNIYYTRCFDDRNVKIWKNPDIYSEINLGEGESILKMIEHAKSHGDNNLYLFMHSKGVTNPKNLERSQISYFLKGKGKKNIDNSFLNKLITDEIIQKVILDWQLHIDNLKNRHFYYFVWNIFWVRSDFLKKFDFKDFNNSGQFPKKYTLNNRHWSAIFPINLYGVVHRKSMLFIRSLIDIYL